MNATTAARPSSAADGGVRPETARPLISVVVATCNRPAVLAQTLEALSADRQQVPADSYEVIVADDSRTDATQVMVAERFPRVVYVKGPRRGPASNRNRGAETASGTWVAFIDDDCRPVDGWLQALCDQARTGDVDVVEGQIVVPDKHDSPFRRYVENLSGGNFWSGNLALRRDLFFRLGAFDDDACAEPVAHSVDEGRERPLRRRLHAQRHIDLGGHASSPDAWCCSMWALKAWSCSLHSRSASSSQRSRWTIGSGLRA